MQKSYSLNVSPIFAVTWACSQLTAPPDQAQSPRADKTDTASHIYPNYVLVKESSWKKKSSEVVLPGSQAWYELQHLALPINTCFWSVFWYHMECVTYTSPLLTSSVKEENPKIGKGNKSQSIHSTIEQILSLGSSLNDVTMECFEILQSLGETSAPERAEDLKSTNWQKRPKQVEIETNRPRPGTHQEFWFQEVKIHTKAKT